MESCKAKISVSEVTILHVYEFIFLAVGNPDIHPCCKAVSTKGHGNILAIWCWDIDPGDSQARRGKKTNKPNS